jgi:hypothetical protein
MSATGVINRANQFNKSLSRYSKIRVGTDAFALPAKVRIRDPDCEIAVGFGIRYFTGNLPDGLFNHYRPDND